MTAPALNFVVVFWGAEHREFFLRLCAPSLLAPGNIPALANREGSRVLLCTTTDDWTAMQGDRDFIALNEAIAVERLDIPQPQSDDNKYLVMSSGHALATDRIFRDRACGVFLTPDLVVADGGVVRLQELAAAGKRVVLSVALRFTLEGCVPAIEKMRAGPGEPLVLEKRWLSRLALDNLHMETLRYDWDAPCFAEMPYNVFWRVPGGAGIVTHGFNWAPVLADYSNLDEHDTSTFESWTMDGDYVMKNFGEEGEALHVIQDTDEFLLVSFTPRADRPGKLSDDALDPKWFKHIPVFGHYWKLARLRWMASMEVSDPLKRRLFPTSVRICGADAPETAWAAVERRARDIVTAAQRAPGPIEILVNRLSGWVQGSPRWPFRLLSAAASATPARGNIRFMNQAGVGSHRARVVAQPVSSGKWYWEVHSGNLGALEGAIAYTGTVGVLGPTDSLMLEVGSSRNGWGWRADGTRLCRGKQDAYGTRASDVRRMIMLALDADRGRLWIGADGAWPNGRDPGSGSRPTFDGLKRPLFPAISSCHGASGTAELMTHMRPEDWAFPAPDGFKPLVLKGRPPAEKT